MAGAFSKLVEFVTAFGRKLVQDWSDFWFTPADAATLACIRLFTGLCLLYLHASCAPDCLSYIGPQAWVDRTAVEQLALLPATELDSQYGWSIWNWVNDPAKARLLYFYFLAAIVMFTIGLCSRTANLLVWVGHLSFVHRSMITWYGVDVMLSMLLFYLLWSPTGNAWSVDRWLKRRRLGSKTLDPEPPSYMVNLSIRAIQLHMCIVYLCSGLSKLQGEAWWNGSAIWQVLMIRELGIFDMRGLAVLDNRTIQILSSAGVLATIAFEVSFVFLIWNPRWRPVLLTAAMLLHGMIGMLMGLGVFSAVMLTGCLSFVPPGSIRKLIDWWRRKEDEPGTTERERPQAISEHAVDGANSCR